MQDAINWVLSILDKLKSLKKINAFKIIRGRILANSSLITARQVLWQKFKANSLIRRRKARLVAKGYKQQARIDYFKTFILVIRYITLQILLAKAVKEDLEIDYININIIFLNLLLKETICL